MDFDLLGEALHEPQAAPPSIKKQADFASFLVNSYFAEPYAKNEQSLRLQHKDELFDLAYRDNPFTAEAVEIVGRICEDTLLLDQKHIPEKPPFVLVERPLLLPAIVGALLGRYLFEKSGIFLSSTMCDQLASKALGLNLRLLRVWFEAERRVTVALSMSSAQRLVNQRSASESGIHAIKTQGRRGAALHTMWVKAHQLFCRELCVEALPLEASQSAFAASVQRAIALRLALESFLRSDCDAQIFPASTLYSMAEPEICGCLVFVTFFDHLESTFSPFICSRKAKAISAECSMQLFQGCLNAFSLNRYHRENLSSAFELLDAVRSFASGKKATPLIDIGENAGEVAFSAVHHVPLLSSDQVATALPLLVKTNVECAGSLCSLRVPFSSMDAAAVQVRTMFPFHLLTSGATASPAAPCENAECGSPEADLENWKDYTDMQILRLDSEDCGASHYILLDDERKGKEQVFQKMYGLKRERSL